MANTLKSKKVPKISEEALNPDKEASVNVTEVVKDERTSKIAGSILLLLTIFLFVAFTSYLFTWQEDQDKVQLWRTNLFSTTDVKVNNQLGFIGAFVAYQIMFNGFGLAAYLFCAFTFVIGVNLFFTKPIFSIWRNVRYVLLGLLVLSTCFAFVTRGAAFSWGGALGEFSSSWLIKWVGSFGTGAILLVAGFSYFIWRVNPKFNTPNFDFLIPKKKEVPFVSEEEGAYAPDAEAIRKEWDLNNPAPIVEEAPTGNRLKNNTAGENGISVIMPESDEMEEGGKLFIDELALTEDHIAESELAPSLVVEQENNAQALFDKGVESIEESSEDSEDSEEDFTDLDDELLEDLDLEVNEGVKEEVVTAAAIGSLATK